ncbi:potassium voltage-gated channel protein Shaw-like isoform X2 [Mizuhopecten yessoensis]|uniref:potassium voltage-gated channel protein Shaw-like isoform X2 n=1 Tax=Mizuhopecten yessoensis TaxID=6573 RepID=UPI000B45F894|nr:potassium voltage-gated channel protein Shaw-like isoform X2 [Mizuhopecten yessoensis]
MSQYTLVFPFGAAELDMDRNDPRAEYIPLKARRTSLPQLPRDPEKSRKSSSIGHLRSLTAMTDSDDDDSGGNDVCVKCNRRKVAISDSDGRVNGNCFPLENRPDDKMAFSAAIVVGGGRGGGGGGGGGILKNRNRVNLDNVELQEVCRCPNTESCKYKNRETVILNVGGQVFETLKTTLKRLKTCKLARDSEMMKHYRETKGDFFFDRDPQAFSVILNYLRTGELHLPTYLCGPALQREFEYWGVQEMDIERCCWQPYNTWKTQNQSLEKLEYDRKRSTTLKELEEDRKSASCWKRSRARVWNFLQDPNSSCCAKIYAWISIVFVFMSIFSFCAETHPDFQVHPSTTQGYEDLYNLFALKDKLMIDVKETSGVRDLSNVTISVDNKTLPGEEAEDDVNTVPHPALLIIDLICVTFFTLEFVTRFVFCPRKVQFITALQNIIDFVAIVPDYIEFIIHAFYPSGSELPFMDFIVILRMLRLCRIFRLIRHVPGLWILLYTLKASFNELLLMFVFLLIGMVVFASLIHFAEGKKGFDNIPIGFWWSVVTMTTVGYGDMHPTTAFGYIIGSLCAISGLLMIAFTVPIIVSNFVLYYTHVQYGIVRHEREKSKLLDFNSDDEECCVDHSENPESETAEQRQSFKNKRDRSPTDKTLPREMGVPELFSSKSTDGNFNKL